MSTLKVHKAAELVLYAVKKGLVRHRREFGRMRDSRALGRARRSPRWRRPRRAARRAGAARHAHRRHARGRHHGRRTTTAPPAASSSPRRWVSGAAFVDYDNDGHQDLLFVNGLFRRRRTLARSIATTARAVHGRQARVGLQPKRNGTASGAGPTSPPSPGLDGRKAGRGRVRADGVDCRRAATTAWASPPPTIDNDGGTDVVLTSVGRHHAVSQRRGGRFVDVDDAGRARRPARRSARGRCGSTIDRDGSSICWCATTCSGRRRPTSTAAPTASRRRYCTPRGLSRQHVVAVRNKGDGTLRGRHRQGRALRRDRQVARRDGARPRRGRLAGPVRRQRHAAEQAVSQQPRRHVHRARAAERRGVQRGRTGARRHGRRRRRCRQLRPRRRWP